MALLGNIINGMLIPTAIPFALVAMTNALFVGYFSRFKFLATFLRQLLHVQLLMLQLQYLQL